MNIQIDSARCVQCGRCVAVCPVSIFQGRRGEVPQVDHPEGCIACGHCVAVCRGDSIRHEAFPPATVRPVRRDLLPTPESLMELIRSRRSNRTLLPQPIPPEALADILEAARYAPTAENTRRVRVTVIDDAAHIQRVEDGTMRFFLRLARVLLHPLVRPLTRRLLPDLYRESPELVRFERRWRQGERPCTCNAPVLLAFSTPAGYDFGPEDSNLAYQNASLMAEAHGLSQIYMGLVQTACKLIGTSRTRRLLGLPPGHRLQALMALGVPKLRFERYAKRG